MRYPAPLLPGDKVCVVSPAGKIAKEVIDKAVQTLRAWGLEPIVAEHAFDECGRFASTKENRLLDLENALLDTRIKAILCSRGGYGAVQLLEAIPREMIRHNVKWLIGYSDITLLHAAFTNSGVVSLHAPMAKHIGEYPQDEVTETIRSILFGGRPKYKVESHPLNRPGFAEGSVIGGNLAVMSGLRGTPYDFNYKGSILFIEDIGESPYKIERMLYNLRLGGVFEQIGGLIVGQFSDCAEDPSMDSTIYENIRRMVDDYTFPVCFDFPCGHVTLNVPLLEGAPAFFEVTDKEVILRFLE